MPKKPASKTAIILILGALSTVSPFSIDMYLSAFPQIALDLHTTVAQVALSLSSYFVGMSVGQLFYGPLLDRFGRKRPLALGLILYILACIGCLQSHSVGALVAFRLLQALGGCAAQVASMALVRDLFPVKEGAKVFSLLMLILGVSPLLAPTVGSFLATAWGWQAVFVLLACIVALILFFTLTVLPAGQAPDAGVSLQLAPVLGGYLRILKNAQFYTYALSGAFSLAGLFVYVAGSPVIFMDVHHVSPKTYGFIFALLSVGFIGGAQVNIALSRHFSTQAIFRTSTWCQSLIALAFMASAAAATLNLEVTVGFFFLLLCSLGISYPNSAALALAPFSKNAGSASALMGFLQVGTGALASAGVAFFGGQGVLPILVVLACTACFGLATLLVGRRHIHHLIEGHAGDEAVPAAH